MFECIDTHLAFPGPRDAVQIPARHLDDVLQACYDLRSAGGGRVALTELTTMTSAESVDRTVLKCKIEYIKTKSKCKAKRR